jgi:hypothetical protein
MAKLSDAGAIRGAVGHNARTRTTPNAAPGHAGKTWENAAQGPAGELLDPHTVVLERIAKSPKAKIRSNSVLAVEIFLGASPEYFRPGNPAAAGTWDRDRMVEWAKASRRWLFDTYGDRIVDCRLHLDESTPHIQAVIVPLTEDGRLSARDLFNPTTLVDLQDRYAAHLSQLGLERGVKGSKAIHQDVQRFYGAANAAAPPPVTVAPPPPTPTPPLLGREEWAKGQTQAGKKWSQDQTKRARAQTARQAAKAAAADIDRTARKGAEATARHLASKVERKEAQVAALTAERDQLREQLRETANRLRDVPIVDVLRMLGLDPDPADPKKQFVMPGHRVSVTGEKFFDHDQTQGGGGAIDAAIIVGDMDYRQAVAWLADHFGDGAAAAAVRADAPRIVRQVKQDPRPSFSLPQRSQNLGLVTRVREYLVRTRAIAADLVDGLFNRGQVYADDRGNAVFVCTDEHGKATGAELKGTMAEKPFSGMAKGSRRNDGAFTLSRGTGQGRVILVESAIDAASYWQMHDGDYTVVSTAGARPNLPWPWVKDAAAAGKLVCAYDADTAGDDAAAKLAAAYPGTLRHRPDAGDKDWNDRLKSIGIRSLAASLAATTSRNPLPSPSSGIEP